MWGGGALGGGVMGWWGGGSLSLGVSAWGREGTEVRTVQVQLCLPRHLDRGEWTTTGWPSVTVLKSFSTPYLSALFMFSPGTASTYARE